MRSHRPSKTWVVFLVLFLLIQVSRVVAEPPIGVDPPLPDGLRHQEGDVLYLCVSGPVSLEMQDAAGQAVFSQINPQATSELLLQASGRVMTFSYMWSQNKIVGIGLSGVMSTGSEAASIQRIVNIPGNQGLAPYVEYFSIGQADQSAPCRREGPIHVGGYRVSVADQSTLPLKIILINTNSANNGNDGAGPLGPVSESSGGCSLIHR